MSDSELNEDRSEWMKVYGRDPSDDFDSSKEAKIFPM